MVAVVAVVLLYLRLPFAAHQFWAEDGRDFFGAARQYGPLRSLGHSQAGYYLLASRLGGVFASLAPIRAAALTMWLWVALVVAWLVATVTLSSRTWLRTWPARIFAALSIVVLGVAGQESIGNAANLQFPMLFASLIVLIGRPRSRLERVNGCVLLIATGLTTPLTAALLPFAAWRMVRTRQLRPDPYVISWLIGVAVQWLAIAVTRPTGPPRTGATVSTIVRQIEAASFRQTLVPSDFLDHSGPWVAITFGVIVIAVAALGWTRRQREKALLLVAVPTFGVALVVVLALISGAAYRYMVFGGLCIVWTAVAGAEVVADSLPPSWSVPAWAVSAAVVAVLILAVIPRWTPSEIRRSGPTWTQSLRTARAKCGDDPEGSVRVRTAPLREQKPDQWSVVVTCRDLE